VYIVDVRVVVASCVKERKRVSSFRADAASSLSLSLSALTRPSERLVVVHRVATLHAARALS
jgi:hypothetical protein